MAWHIGSYSILAGAPIFSALCCICFHRIHDIYYRSSRIKRGTLILYDSLSLHCLINHIQTLPLLVAKKKNENGGSSIPDEATVKTPLINHGESLDYGTTTVEAQSSPSGSTITSPKDKPLLFNRGLIIIYLNFATLSFLDIGYSALLPLFYSTSIPLGGVGLDPYKIGIILGTFGCLNAIVQARFLGPSIRKFGARKLYIFSFPGLFACVTLYPIIRHFAQHFGRVNNIVVVCMIVQLMFQMLIFSSFGIILYSRWFKSLALIFISKVLYKLSWYSMYPKVDVLPRLSALLRCAMLQWDQLPLPFFLHSSQYPYSDSLQVAIWYSTYWWAWIY